MVQSINIPDGEDGVPKFPGPHTLFSSRKKWLRPTLGSALFMAVGIAMILYAAPFGIFVTLGFGVRTMIGAGIFVTVASGVGTTIGVMMLLPGASSLRLDESGFEVTKFFLRQRYRWRDVSDFVAWRMISKGIVVFREEKPCLGAYERINAAMTGGRNGYLPDTYGMAVDNLVRLMTSWRNSATNATK
jgi:hypothetical protein